MDFNNSTIVITAVAQDEAYIGPLPRLSVIVFDQKRANGYQIQVEISWSVMCPLALARAWHEMT